MVLPGNKRASKVNLNLGISREKPIMVRLEMRSSPDSKGHIQGYAKTLSSLGKLSKAEYLKKDGGHLSVFKITPSLDGSELVKKLLDSNLPRKTIANDTIFLYQFSNIDTIREDTHLLNVIKKRIDESNTPKLKALSPEKLRELTSHKTLSFKPIKKNQPTPKPSPTLNSSSKDISEILQNPIIYNGLSQNVKDTLNNLNSILERKYGFPIENIYSAGTRGGLPLWKAIFSNILSKKAGLKVNKIAKILNISDVSVYNKRANFSPIPNYDCLNLEETVESLKSAYQGKRQAIDFQGTKLYKKLMKDSPYKEKKKREEIGNIIRDVITNKTQKK